MSEINPYRAQWDSYVREWRRRAQPDGSGSERIWPGDEWGNKKAWSTIFQVLFLDAGVGEWRRCVEIGPGSGKYTNLVLRNSEANITAFDISSEYLAVLKERLSADIDSGRVDPVVIPGQRASELFEYLAGKGLDRQLDGFYSIDAMVHVDLLYILAYILTAALTLKEHGRLILTLANAVSEQGFAHLIGSVKHFYPLQGIPSGKFEYVSPEIVRVVLERLGFTVEFASTFSDVKTERDLYVLATLSDLAPAENLRWALL